MDRPRTPRTPPEIGQATNRQATNRQRTSENGQATTSGHETGQATTPRLDRQKPEIGQATIGRLDRTIGQAEGYRPEGTAWRLRGPNEAGPERETESEGGAEPVQFPTVWANLFCWAWIALIFLSCRLAGKSELPFRD